MPRRKKRPRELTSEEMLRRLFPKEVRELARKEARKAAPKGEKKATEEPNHARTSPSRVGKEANHAGARGLNRALLGQAAFRASRA